jgi:membrane protease YdiL (CAAX protease family)
LTNPKISVRQSVVILIGLALTLGLVVFRANEFGQRYLGMGALASRDLFWWPLLAVTLLYVIVVERRPLASIGIHRPTWKTFALGVGAAVLGLAVVFPLTELAMTYLHLPGQAGSAAAQQIAHTPWWYRIVLVVRAALAEEIVFRGYAIERITELTGSRTLAAIVSLTVFTVAHLAFWGWTPLIGVAVAGLLLTILYLWQRDLVANIIAHFVVDAVGIFF